MTSLAATQLNPPVSAAGIAKMRALHTKKRFYFVVLGGVIAFVISKHLTSAGAVTLDNFAYWGIGLCPIILILLISGFLRRSQKYLQVDEIFFATIWIVSLLNFIILRVLIISEAYEIPIYSALKYNILFSYLTLSALYALYGTTLVVTIKALFGRAIAFRSPHIALVLVGFSINFVMFFVFVFAIDQFLRS